MRPSGVVYLLAEVPLTEASLCGLRARRCDALCGHDDSRPGALACPQETTQVLQHEADKIPGRFISSFLSWRTLASLASCCVFLSYRFLRAARSGCPTSGSSGTALPFCRLPHANRRDRAPRRRGMFLGCEGGGITRSMQVRDHSRQSRSDG
jgi:hypothetical protein